MKKIIIICAIALSFLNVFAQKGDDKNPEQKAQKASAFLQRKLNLTDDQKSNVYKSMLERITKIQELRAQNLEKTAMLQQSKPIRDNFNASMKTILTPDQFTQWEQLKSDRKNNKGESRKGREKQKKLEEKSDSLGDVD